MATVSPNASVKLHVAIFAFPFASHATNLLLLARQLASSAPAITFSFFSTPRSKASHLLARLPPNLKIRDVEDGLQEGYVPTGQLIDEIQLFLEAAPSNFRAALQKAEDPKVSCLLTDAFVCFAGEIAEEMGIPWLSFWSPGACSLSVHCNTDLIRKTIGTRCEEVNARLSESLSFLPGFSQFQVGDLQEGIVFGPLHSFFSELLRRVGRELPRAKAVLINTVSGLEIPAVLDHLNASFKMCIPVGPISLLSPVRPSDSQSDFDYDADTHSCLSWLDSLSDDPASVAYVSFGTVSSLPPPELAAVAEGLEAGGWRFLWSLKDGLRESLPHGFLERTKGRGLVVPWTPQVSVLRHAAVGAFVTHSGWNSLLESAAAGVPMLCRPFFGDHRINQRLASHVLRIAVGVHGGVLTKEAVVDGLRLILHSDEGRRMRERARALAAMVADAVGEGGTSSRNLKSVVEIITGC